MLNVIESLEARPDNARSVDSEPISMVLELNIGVGWKAMLLPRYVGLDRLEMQDREGLGGLI